MRKRHVLFFGVVPGFTLIALSLLLNIFSTLSSRTTGEDVNKNNEGGTELCDATGTCVYENPETNIIEHVVPSNNNDNDNDAKTEGDEETPNETNGLDIFSAWVNDRMDDGTKFLNEVIFSKTDDEDERQTDKSGETERSKKKKKKGWFDDLKDIFEGNDDKSKQSEDDPFFLNKFLFHDKEDSSQEAVDRSWFDDLKDVFDGKKNVQDVNTTIEEEESKNSGMGIAQVFQSFLQRDPEEATTNLIQRAIDFTSGMNASEQGKNFMEVWKLFRESLSDVKDSLKRSFEHLDSLNFKTIILSFFYYLEHQDEIKTPSWKRRKHRFLQTVDVKQIDALHDALYLADLSYANTMDKIKERLNATQTGLELIYSQIQAEPNKPSHFIALKKEQSLWSDSLEVVIIVRGTKQLGDLLSDAFLDAVDYRDGKVHAGMLLAGRYLVDKHLRLLNGLLEMSKKTHIKLSLVGHSLGAGAASIAAMEFNDQPNIDASVVGFGCPALLSKELSESANEYITTVVADSDIIPRMSAATVTNTILDMMSYDWTDKALEDAREMLDVIQKKAPIQIPRSFVDSVMKYVNNTLQNSVKPAIKNVPTERLEPVLIPPGHCIHFYRDGSGVSGAHTPCDFFSSIDVTRTIVDDHLIPPGYHKVFLELVRNYHHDLNYAFWNDISGDY